MGERVLVTGANRGIGRAIIDGLLAAGHLPVMTSRRPCEVPEGASWHALDVCSEQSVAALAAWLERPLDAVVNNAGVALDGFDAEVAEKTIDTNVLGPVRVTDALLPHIVDGGRIVMVSSGMGDRGCLSADKRARFSEPMTREELFAEMRGFVESVAEGRHAEEGWPSSAYRVSKIGLNKLTEIYAAELEPRSIRCNAACPGWVRTDMGGRGAPRSPEEGAKTPIWLALEVQESGGFFRDESPASW